MLKLLIVGKEAYTNTGYLKKLLGKRININEVSIFAFKDYEDALKAIGGIYFDYAFISEEYDRDDFINFIYYVHENCSYKEGLIVPMTIICDSLDYIVYDFKHLSAVDIVAKPLARNNFERTLDFISYIYYMKGGCSRATPCIYIETSSTSYRINASSIIYVEYSNGKTHINTYEEKITFNSSLKHISQFLSDEYIIQCHRSFYINIENVKSIERINKVWSISFVNCDRLIPVTRCFREKVMEVFMNKRKGEKY